MKQREASLFTKVNLFSQVLFHWLSEHHDHDTLQRFFFTG